MAGLTLRDTGLAILVSLIWGMGFVVAKGGMSHFPPILLMALRFSITALALVWFMGPVGSNLPRLALISVVGASLQYSLTFSGVNGLGAGLAALVVQLEVPFLVILGAVLLGERPTARKWLGILIAFAGVGVIASQEQFSGSMASILLVMGGALAWAFGQVLVRRLTEMTGLSVTAWIAVLAAPQLRPLGAVRDGADRGYPYRRDRCVGCRDLSWPCHDRIGLFPVEQPSVAARGGARRPLPAASAGIFSDRRHPVSG